MTAQREPGITLATSLLQPFYKLLASYELSPYVLLEKLRALGPDARVPWDEAVTLLLTAIELTGDADLGLKAGRILDLEDGGALAYAASSANTLRDAMNVAGRYMGLLSGLMTYRVVVHGARAEVHLDSEVALPRAAADFQASALRTHHRRTHSVEIPGLEWCFRHERPAVMEEYERTFGATRLTFSAPYFGFSFDARFLDIPLRTADSRQHQRMLGQMEAALAEIPKLDTVAGGVRRAIMRDLASTQLSVSHVAHALRMSRRTLARRLHEEGTSFSELVDDTRRRMAQHYLTESDRSVAQIALQLGFSEVATFYRAFRRWMQMTPVEYRQRVASGASPAPQGEPPSAPVWSGRRAL
jgi:AraC-like DNA-binding protein